MNIYDSTAMKMAQKSRAKPNIEISIPETTKKILSMSSNDLFGIFLAGLYLAVFDEIDRARFRFEQELHKKFQRLTYPITATYKETFDSVIVTLVDSSNHSISYKTPVYQYFFNIVNSIGIKNIDTTKVVFDEQIYFCIIAAIGTLGRNVTLSVGTRKIRLPKAPHQILIFSQPSRISIYKNGVMLDDLNHYKVLFGEIGNAVYKVFKIN